MVPLKLHQPASLIRDAAVLSGQIALLWLVNWFAHQVVDTWHLTVPGNVAALLLMLALLQLRLIPLSFVDRGSAFLLRHLALFFLPIAVGLMTFATLWVSSGLSILVTLFVSAAVGFAVTGYLCQRFAGLLQRVPTTIVVSRHEPDLDPS